MYNQAILVGRLGQDPQPRVTTSGITFVNFSIACNRAYKGKDGERETDWIDCVAWRERAEFVANYLKKGNLVLVQGSIQVRKWEDQNGQPRRSVEIQVERVENLTPRGDGGGAAHVRDEDAPPAPRRAPSTTPPKQTETNASSADAVFNSADDEYDPFGGE